MKWDIAHMENTNQLNKLQSENERQAERIAQLVEALAYGIEFARMAFGVIDMGDYSDEQYAKYNKMCTALEAAKG